MLLGLDVGGTQTDAVLVDGSGILAETKIPTGEDLLETLGEILRRTLTGVDRTALRRMTFSTTLATNAIVTDQLDPTGMLVSAGPGMDPAWFSVGPSYHVLAGCIDHQGNEVLPLQKSEVLAAAERIHAQGIDRVGVVSKFGVRNPVHEQQIAGWLAGRFASLALGHGISGILNFPRRVATTYLDAALHTHHARFIHALEATLDREGLLAPRYLLKPDGGTLSLEKSLSYPSRIAQSGPAASVMGAMALDPCTEVCLVLDIGGTTTDMAVLHRGVPLFEPVGIRIGPYRTLIRSLLTHSVGIGGDSAVRRDDRGTLRIGPLRKGRAMALGGPEPTPTDAMIALGLLGLGDRERAVSAMRGLGAEGEGDPLGMARSVLRRMAELIALSAGAFLSEINARPVFTINEVLEGQRVDPEGAVLIGGPAPFLKDFVQEALGLRCRVPPHFGVANAVGAAVSRVTAEIGLQADTERGTVVIPEAGVNQPIDGQFGPEEALALAERVLRAEALAVGANPEEIETSVVERQVFSMIRGYRRVGKNIRLRLSVAPGLLAGWKRG